MIKKSGSQSNYFMHSSCCKLLVYFMVSLMFFQSLPLSVLSKPDKGKFDFESCHNILLGIKDFCTISVAEAQQEENKKDDDKNNSDTDNDDTDDNNQGNKNDEENNQKIIICHFSPGNPDNPQTITVSENALDAHLAHGDTLGACEFDVNNPPSITSEPITTATENVPYAYDVDATDPEGDVLTYSLEGSSAGMTINRETGLIEWVPDATQVGDNNVVVRASDNGGLFDRQSFVVTVINVNDAPSITSVAVTGATQNVAYAYDVNATDPDTGDILTYSLEVFPIGMTIDTTTGLIDWTPDATQVGDNSVTVIAADTIGLFDTQSFIVSVIDINDQPVITSAPVTEATQNEPYAYDVDATDPDPGELLTYSLDVFPAGMTINPVSGLIAWTPISQQIGDNNVTTRVVDLGGLFNVQSFVVSVTNVNDSPSIISSPVTGATQNVAYEYNVDATDADPGDLLTYSLEIFPAGMSIDPVSGLIVWIPDATQVGDNSVIVMVVDSIGLFSTQSFIVSVIDTNDQPFITSTPVTTATENAPYAYDVEATDLDAEDLLTYSLDVFPTGLTINSVTGLIDWTPDATQVGDNNVTVRAVDTGGLFDTQSFVITVINVNDAPSITSVPVTTANENVPYIYNVASTDLDVGDILTYSLDVSPTGMNVDPATGQILWIADTTQIGDNSVTVRVTDIDGLFDTQSFIVTVINVNDAPSITSAPVTTATENIAYVYDVEATDPDAGDILTYFLDVFPAGMTIDPVTGLIAWTPSPNQVSNNSVTVHVEDIEGLVDIQSFVVFVINVNDPPSITSAPVTIATENVVYVYDVDAIDLDGALLTYSLDVFPPGMTIDSDTGLILWLPETTQVGDNNVTVRVSDSGGLFDTQSYVVSVVNINDAPSITSAAVIAATENVAYAYDVDVTDPDAGDIVTYSLDVSPANMIIDSNTGLIVWTPDPAQIGDNSVTVRATDIDGLFDTQSFVITVINVNDAPLITSVAVITADEDVAYSYDVDAVDPDAGDILTYSLDVSPSSMTIDSVTGLIVWTPDTTQVGDNNVIVRAVDSGDLFDTQSFIITVVKANSIPVANSGGPYFGNLDQPVVFDGSGSLDIDNDPLVYSWDFGDGSTGAGINPSHQYSILGDFDIILTVDDGRGGVNSAASTVKIGNTSFSGVVLDATDETPIPGVTVFVRNAGSVARTDSLGNFTIALAPNSEQEIVVDGRTATRSDFNYPLYSFPHDIIAENANVRTRPVYLPRLTNETFPVSDTQPTVVTNSQMPGLSMTVNPGTVIFTDPDNPAELSISEVPRDRTPSSLPPELDPAQVITIQPAGTVFLEPAAITFPNLQGFTPGTKVPIWSMSHDAGTFFCIGGGTVNDDGTLIVSDPGVGILGSSWHFPALPFLETPVSIVGTPPLPLGQVVFERNSVSVFGKNCCELTPLSITNAPRGEVPRKIFENDVFYIGAFSEVVASFRDGSMLHVNTDVMPARFRIATLNDSSGFEEIQKSELFNRQLITVNQGAEEGTASDTGQDVVSVPGWSTTSNFTMANYDTTIGGAFGLLFPTEDPTRFDGGQQYFSGGPDNAFSSASQTFDLTSLSASIDIGLVLARLDGLMATQDDELASVVAEFLNSSGTPVGSFSISLTDPTQDSSDPFDTGGTFVPLTAVKAVPSGARSVSLTMEGTRGIKGDAYNNTYFDNISLILGPRDSQLEGGNVPTAGRELNVSVKLFTGEMDSFTSNMQPGSSLEIITTGVTSLAQTSRLASTNRVDLTTIPIPNTLESLEGITGTTELINGVTDTLSSSESVTILTDPVDFNNLVKAIVSNPTALTLREIGRTEQLEIRQIFYEGLTGDVTSGSAGTTYTSTDPTVVTVSEDGLVAAIGNGSATIIINNVNINSNSIVVPVEVATDFRVINVTFTEDDQGVDIDGEIFITFSRSLDPNSVGTATIQLKNGASIVGGSLSLLPGNRTAVFDPELPLSSGSPYSINVTTGVKDFSGLAIAQNFNKAFNTTTDIAPVLLGIKLLPEEFTLGVVPVPFYNPQQQLTLLGEYSTGIERNLAPQFAGTTYMSSNPDVAVVSSDGLVTTLSKGRAVITASNEGFSDSVVVDVFAPVPLAKLTISSQNLSNVDASGDLAFVAGGGAGLKIIDISDPRKSVIRGSLPLDWANDVIVQGDLAYVGTGRRINGGSIGSLKIIDVSDPENPVIAGDLTPSDLPACYCDLALKRDVALAAASSDGLHIIDIRDKNNPSLISRYAVQDDDVRGVVVQANIAYLADFNLGLQIIDISDPSNPVLLGSILTPNPANDLQVIGDLVYIATGLSGQDEGGLAIVDVTDPANPRLTGTLDRFNAKDLVVAEDTVFLTGQMQGRNETILVNVLDKSNPLFAGVINWQGTGEGNGLDIDISTGLLFDIKSDVLQIAQILPPAELDGRFDLGARGIAGITEGDDGTTLEGSNIVVRPTLFQSSFTMGSYNLSTLDIEDGATLSLTGNLTATDVTVVNGSKLTHRASTVADGSEIKPMLDIETTTLTIDDTSSIDVSGNGYLGGLRLDNTSRLGRTIGNISGASDGNSSFDAGAGSYGGRGASRSNDVYGDFIDPNELGSGGAGDGGSKGGTGGGLVRITADTIQIDGVINASGSEGTAGCCSGGGNGSGGGIRIDAGTISGIGAINADAGDFGGRTKHAGGGRIAIYYDDISGFDIANISAKGGDKQSNTLNENGGAGTIYLKDSFQNNGDLIIDNGGVPHDKLTTLRSLLPGVSSTIETNTLIDNTGNFPEPDPISGRLGLVGIELNPNTAQGQTFTIIFNTATELFTDPADGDMTLVAGNGDKYSSIIALDNLDIAGDARVNVYGGIKVNDGNRNSADSLTVDGYLLSESLDIGIINNIYVNQGLLRLKKPLTANGIDAALLNIFLDGGILEHNGLLSSQNITLMNGSLLTHRGSRVADGAEIRPMVDIRSTTLSIDETSSIDVTEKGYLGGLQGDNTSRSGRTIGNTQGASDGGSSFDAGGGSYGGAGSARANAVYGDYRNPIELGSGGAGEGGSKGGTGGGLVRVRSDVIQLDGTIKANGGPGEGGCCSGGGNGSGGAIQIDVGVLSGIGTIDADSGNEGRLRRGGGGRIAIYYDDITAFDIANISAEGGLGSSVNDNGGAGTVFLKSFAQSNGDLVVDNGGTETNGFTTSLRAVTPGSNTLLEANKLIDSTGTFPLPDSVTGRIGLIGLELNPNPAQNQTFTIINNTATELFTDPADGDMRLVANSGDTYIGQYLWDNVDIKGEARVVTSDDCIVNGVVNVIEGAIIQCNNLSKEANEPPFIVSTPVTTGIDGVAYFYDVNATDPNPGDLLTYSLDVAPAGMTIDSGTGEIGWTPDFLQRGDNSVTVRVSDIGGMFDTQSFNINVVRPNDSPIFDSSPILVATVEQLFSYDANATDPDAGDALTYSLDVAPTGMIIDSVTGLIEWTPTLLQPGDNPVIVRATDIPGLFEIQSFTVVVNGPPVFVSSSEISGFVGVPYSYDVEASDPNNGDVITYSLDTSPSGMIIDSITGLIEWSPALSQLGDNSVTVRIQDQAGLFATQAFVISVTEDTELPTLNVVLSSSRVNPGEQVTISVTVSDNGPLPAITATVNGAPLALDINNQAFFSSTVPGSYIIEVVATDFVGNQQIFTTAFAVRDSSDTVAPVADLNLPGDLAEITYMTDIIGTANDDNFFHYELSLKEIDATQFTLFAEGFGPVLNGKLGTFDPTLLVNGLYAVRLEVEDINGLTAIAEQTYQVTGEAKIGNFTISFNDLTVPVSGIPIIVVRTYDSRVKTKEDFGIGWTLDIRTGSLQHNRIPGKGWEILSSTGFPSIPCMNVNETLSHLTTVQLSDRESFTFALELNNTASIFGGCEAEASYRFVDGSTPGASLDILDGTQVFWPNDGSNELQYFTDFQLFNPQEVRLTTIAGTKIDIDRNAGGITQITDANGNALTINENGITHSTGKGIIFNRDNQNRITQIIDPIGNPINYTYDVAGDLVNFADQENNLTTFTYDNLHNLIDINDPLGNRAVRNEYDLDGRLIATIDAKGNRIEYTRDIANNEEVVVDSRSNVTKFTYDERGNVLKTEKSVTIEGVTVPVVTTYEYDARSNETVVIDPDGVRTEAIYDSNDYVTSRVINPSGLNLLNSFTYNSFGDVVSQTDGEGNTATGTYDSNGNLTKFVDQLGNTWNIENATNGSVISMELPWGAVNSLVYDSSGNITQETQLDTFGNILANSNYTYDVNGNKLSKTIQRTINGILQDLTTRFEYNSVNQEVKAIDPLGNISITEYNTIGKVSEKIDSLGRRTSFDYDATGALVKTTFPDGTFETIGYDSAGNVIQETNRAGNITTYVYDELNRLIKTIYPDLSYIQTVYSPGGRIMAKIDANGNRSAFEYDNASRKVKSIGPAVLDASGNIIVNPETLFDYNTTSNLTTITDHYGRQLKTIYDASMRPTITTFSDNSSKIRNYNAISKITDITDEEGRSTIFEYDAHQRLVSVKRPNPDLDGALLETSYTYDEEGNKVSQVDALGRTTNFIYDELNRKVKRIIPGGEFESMAYDSMGNLVMLTDFNGNNIVFEYDAMNRLTKRKFMDGSFIETTYTPTGKRATVTDNRRITSYTYDLLDRIVSVNHPGGESVSYTYDANGNRLSMSSGAGIVNYEYDSLNRLVRVIDPFGAITNYKYDALGNLIRLEASNGTITENIYDSRNRLTTITHSMSNGSTLASYDYDISLTGRRMSMTEADGSTETYEYDTLDRLTSELRTGSNAYDITYEYDLVGNRKRMVKNSLETIYTFDVNDRLLTENAITYNYDLNGNIIKRVNGTDTIDYAYDIENRISNVVEGAEVTTFKYDADGNLIQTGNSFETVNFLVDTNNHTGFSQVIEKRDNMGNLLSYFTYGYDLLSMDQGSVKNNYHIDGQMSTRLLTDSSGSVTDTYTYDAFGNLVDSTGSTINPYLYTGEHYDSNLGMYYLRARHYNPTTGRFVTMDTFPGFEQSPISLHKYAYANANPINRIDPSGNFSLSEIGISASIVDSLQTINFGFRLGSFCKLVAKAKMLQTLLAVLSITSQLNFTATAGEAGLDYTYYPKGLNLSGIDELSFKHVMLPGPRGFYAGGTKTEFAAKKTGKEKKSFGVEYDPILGVTLTSGVEKKILALKMCEIINIATLTAAAEVSYAPSGKGVAAKLELKTDFFGFKVPSLIKFELPDTNGGFPGDLGSDLF